MPTLKPEQFPKLNRKVRAKWAPVFLSPILGSPERLIIGVVAIDGVNIHIERANAMDRFGCLYGDLAKTAVFAAELALDELENDCADRGIDAIIDARPAFSGVSIGKIYDGEANSLAEIAQNWMASLSSLYQSTKTYVSVSELIVADYEGERVAERLPTLVLDYVKSRRPGLERFFSSEIREHRERRRRSNIHGVIIDFSGSHVVANFGTLMASNRSTSVDRIKRRMWDLKVNRDSETGAIATRTHEMIVQHPRDDDPQITERQYEAITDAIKGLSEQATKEEIGFKPMTDIYDIGEHILAVEAA